MIMKISLIKALVLLISIVLVVSLLAGCETYNNFRTAFIEKKKVEDVIKIGVFEPLTGVDKKYGELEKRGIELAHQLYPQVLGKKVELLYGDNKSDIFAAESVAKELAAKDPAVILGSYGNALSLMGTDIFLENSIPAIAITCTNPLVTNSSKFYFRVSYVESFQGTAGAKYALEVLNASKAAIMKESGNDFNTEIANVFKTKFKSMTNEFAIVSETEFITGADDFTTQLNSIQSSGAEVVFLPCKASDAGKILAQAKRKNIKAVFIGTDSWESKEIVKSGGSAVDGAVFTSLLDLNVPVNVTRDVFLKAYSKEYGKDAVPDPAEVLGFDAYLIALQAIKTAGSDADGDAIREAIRKTRDFPGASGNISFDSNGDPVKSVFIKEIKDGEFHYIYTSEPIWTN